MYDTLLQMARWFGYRENYGDLCRVWMTAEARGWYSHVASVVEELRSELNYMRDSGLTPLDFGLRVRHHPDALLITDRKKMKTAMNIVTETGYANRFIETYQLSSKARETNVAAVEQLSQALLDAGYSADNAIRATDTWFEVRNVDIDLIVKFLTDFDNSAGNPISLNRSDLVLEYVELNRERLLKWDIAVPFLQKTKGTNALFMGIDFPCPTRQYVSIPPVGGDKFQISRKAKVSVRGQERAGLSESQVQKAEKDIPDGKVSDVAYRGKRTKPLLVVHMVGVVNPDANKTKPASKASIKAPDAVLQGYHTAWGISFPPPRDGDPPEKTVRYALNEVAIKAYLEQFQEDEDMEDE
jgi:hypothetical protein